MGKIHFEEIPTPIAPALKLEHADSRGEIYSLTLDGDKELILLHSKAGSLRGGHAHDVDEVVLMLTGRMKYFKRSQGTNGGIEWEPFEVVGGDSTPHKIGEYHLAEFLEDSWVIEWKIAANKDGWRNIDYTPWRQLVAENASEQRT